MPFPTMCRFLALVVLCSTWTTAASGDSPPSFVVILSDDQGWADIGYHGSDVLTPTLDDLAKDGVRLERFYVYPTCSPTRVALLTGRNPSRFGVHGPIAGKSSKHLPPDTPTIASILAKKGYATHISGKWHLGLKPEYGPTKYGFKTSYGYLHGQIDVYTHRYKFGDRTWHRNDKLMDEEGHATDLITADAVRFIKQQREKPFFLYVAYSVPHYPLKEPEKWTDMYDGKIKDPWRKLFAASITHMDDGIGQIIDALDETGRRKNTLLVFSSDNGGQARWGAPKSQYEGRYQPHTTLGKNDPLRGYKGSLHEGGIRVPALANWPGRLKPAKLDGPAHIMDLLPTFAGLAGADISGLDNLDGQDIWPGLSRGKLDADRTFSWNVRGKQALMHGPWKLITSGKQDTGSLFNLAKDPHEKKDLAMERPDMVKELWGLLRQQQAKDKR